MPTATSRTHPNHITYPILFGSSLAMWNLKVLPFHVFVRILMGTRKDLVGIYTDAVADRICKNRGFFGGLFGRSKRSRKRSPFNLNPSAFLFAS